MVAFPIRHAAGLTAGLLVASFAVAVVPTGAAAAPPPNPTAPSGRPSSVRTIALGEPTLRDSGLRRTAPFSLVGVSWARGTGAGVSFAVRTRMSGRWTAWSTLATSDVAPDAGRRDDRASGRTATEPLWVGPSDGVQVRLATASRRPSGVQIEIVDPGTSPADAALSTAPAGTGTGSPAAAPNALAARAPGVAPTIVSRAGWGADERLRSYNPGCSTPDYGTTVKMGFVHHTDNVNNYTAAQVPGILRSIYAYHVQSNHWCDIGYNFLVDRFGRIFEGRFGGTTLPVIGAHTGGFNTDTFGASMIGTFSAVAPPTAMVNAMADLYAWKLGSYYRNPLGKTVITAGVFDGSRYPAGTRVSFNTISGHRDADFTECPGNQGYAMLPRLRSLVSSRLPRSAIATRYAQLGGSTGLLGEPILQGEHTVPSGLMSQFQNGSLTWSSSTGAWMLSAPFTATYLKVGGPAGMLGYPTTRDEAGTADGIGRSARFQRGFIHSSPATGAHETHGAIADRYAQIRFESGPLGYPQIDVTTRPDGVGRYNRFDRGYIFYTPALGAHEVYGPLLDRWRTLGYEAGVLGYPTTNPAPTADAVGSYQHFQLGSLLWSPSTGPHEVRGAIRDRYASLSWERGELGYPTSDERTVAPGVVQTDFQHGSISWVLATGVTTVTTSPTP
jgi:uncharacterized protein with LGFP repeats